MRRRITALVAGAFLSTVLTSVVLAEAPLQPQNEAPAISKEAQVLNGTVLTLAKALQQKEIAHDKDLPESTLALATSDGQIFLIVKDEGSRALFKDRELHARPVQLVAVTIPGSQLLKVERIRTLVDGELREVDYWCEKCALRYSEPGICICCGAQAERRELPVKKTENTKPAP